jgi:hypothetical protein
LHPASSNFAWANPWTQEVTWGVEVGSEVKVMTSRVAGHTIGLSLPKLGMCYYMDHSSDIGWVKVRSEVEVMTSRVVGHTIGLSLPKICIQPASPNFAWVIPWNTVGTGWVEVRRGGQDNDLQGCRARLFDPASQNLAWVIPWTTEVTGWVKVGSDFEVMTSRA